MKTIPGFPVRGMLLAAFGAAVLSAGSAAGEVTAEVWPFDLPEGVASKVIFEQWRASVPPDQAETIPLDGLSLAARDEPSMTRVAGVLVPPVTGDYAFFVRGPGGPGANSGGETELWIEDAQSGAWTLVQRTGNPNKRSGRTRLEQGEARRFELWHMGSAAIAIDWEVRDWDSVARAPAVALARQTVPAPAIKPRDPGTDHRRDALGPDGPWGDPDGDGLLNWQEWLAGTDPLKADTEGREGLVLWEIWRGIPGRHVFDLTRAADYPAGPRETRYLDRLEIPTGNGENYGSRVRGWIVPPGDGEYTFKIIADGTAELWLGENESWQSKRRLAQANQEPGAARLRWTRGGPDGEVLPLRDEQIARVTLRAGQRYYLEILHKQDGGQDHCAVAWVPPGAEQPELIGAKHIISWQPCPTDSSDDGLPDEWQRAARLLDPSVDEAMRHAEADPDGDGASNREEWLAGTDPLDPADFPGSGRMLLSEAWTGIPGREIASLTGHPRFPAAPDVTTRIDNLDFGQEGENYGVRLRGYLTAPDDGPYHFSISGNNSCVLYLGQSEDKFTKRVIARVEVGGRWRSFTTGGHLRSGPVRLERGKRYYIEVLFKRGGGDGKADHSSVAWRRPGEKRFDVIGTGHFSPYRSDPRDLDDDDLPDEWEILHGLDPADPSGKNGAWGDPDGDGLENFREFQFGLDPNTPDVHGTPGLALWETWENTEGLIVSHRDEGGIATGLWRDLRFPLEATRREWRDALDAPPNQGTNFGARMRAHLVAPMTGDYVFSIAGRDVGELYLSPDDSKFNRSRIASFRHGTTFRAWDGRPGQMSKPVRLEVGKRYYIEALYARGPYRNHDDFFSIGWKTPGSDRFRLIDSKHLVAFFRDPNDRDDDDLPDDWESHHGLDPTDPRGDHGPHGDPDRDGLTNIEEYRLGTHPRNADTDGDGISDYDEVHVYGTDPLVPDVIPAVKYHDFQLGEAGSSSASWMETPDGNIRSLTRLSSLEFMIEIDRPGIYLLELVARAVSPHAYVPPIPVVARIDGREIGRADIAKSDTGRRWLTPWLTAGPHRVTIDDRNIRLGQMLEIVSVALYRHDGDDLDGNGVPDWMEGLFRSRYSVDSPRSSAVSPICLGGTWRFEGSVHIEAGGQIIPALPATDGRWFADVPLDPAGRTTVTVHFENGALREILDLEWTDSSLTALPDRIRVRPGDALKFSAGNPGDGVASPASATLLLDGAPAVTHDSAGTRVLAFVDPGQYQLTASTGSGGDAVTVGALVEVMAADFGETFHICSGYPRYWKVPGVSPELHVEADPGLSLEALSGPEPGFRADCTSAGPALHAVVARLWPDGPVVATSRVNSFRLVSSRDSRDARVVGILPDGTRIVEFSFVIDGSIPPDLVLRVDLIVPDAVFASGGTSHRLVAADFDQSGIARLVAYKAPGGGVAAICHRVLPYPDDSPASED